ncbi:acyltransferase [Aeribacillus pallidus]|uniref:acyltransferase n=1 Tax=Aeribacillus pallidus TaxID=33936 RepID=UPI001022EA75|nr:acyltransferase [Aeribacillus pallidus]RZI50420.1 acyltransferase [Aeribacillus pallidus]
MTGRELFRKYKFIIRILEKIVGMFPSKFLRGFWAILDLSSGKFGILMRYLIIKNLSQKCGDNVYIAQNVELKNIHMLKIGDNVSIHRGCYLDAAGGIEIGNNVSIAHQTSLVSFNHTWSNPNIPIKYNEISKGKITIEDDVWIGCGCRILADVTIRSRSVIAAGAVVTSDIPSNCIAAGIPAKVVKEI